MKIWIDIDEVLSDSIPVFLEYYNMENNTDYKPAEMYTYKFWKVFWCTKEEAIDSCKRCIKTGFFKDPNPVEWAVEWIKLLHWQWHELFAITARVEEFYEQTFFWLWKHFPNYFKWIHFSSNYYESESHEWWKFWICQDLWIDVMVEDSADFAQDISENGIPVLLRNTPWNQTVDWENIIRCSDWNEIVEAVEMHTLNYQQVL